MKWTEIGGSSDNSSQKVHFTACLILLNVFTICSARRTFSHSYFFYTVHIFLILQNSSPAQSAPSFWALSQVDTRVISCRKWWFLSYYTADSLNTKKENLRTGSIHRCETQNPWSLLVPKNKSLRMHLGFPLNLHIISILQYQLCKWK